MWILLALGSAITAALVAIFGKMGLSGLDTTVATTLRSIIMAVFLVIFSLATNKLGIIRTISLTSSQWGFILAAGIAGAVSWLLYFAALSIGLATHVAAIDRLSVLFVVILAAIFLQEALTLKVIIGAILMVFGILLITMK